MEREKQVKKEQKNFHDIVEKLKHLTKKQKIIIGVIAALFVIYVAGVLFFHWHFQPQTTINGHKFGFKSGNDVKAALTQKISDHDLTLVQRNDQKEVIKAEDIDARLEYQNQVYHALREQNEFLWFVESFTKKNVTLDPEISYDSNKLQEKISSLKCLDRKNDINVENARIEFKDGDFQIIPEVLGTEVVEEKLVAAVSDAYKKNQNQVDLEKAGCYKEPEIYSTDKKATDALRVAKKYAGATITYRFARETEVVDKKTKSDWIKFDEDLKVSLDSEKVAQYIAKLAEEYDTLGKSVKLKTANRGTVTVPGGTYGWKIDQEKETERLIDLIKQGRSLEKEPAYSQRGEVGVRTTVNGNPKTYVEINIAEQNMWFYKDGKRLVDTPVVTGDVIRPGRRTHTGAYYIFYKQSPAVLRGEDYASPVTFWMAFHNGEGIHDASWRGVYGGSIYKGGGSHGCVNTPYANAQIIYKNTEVGTPVFVYDN